MRKKIIHNFTVIGKSRGVTIIKFIDKENPMRMNIRAGNMEIGTILKDEQGNYYDESTRSKLYTILGWASWKMSCLLRQNGINPMTEDVSDFFGKEHEL